MAFHWRQKIHLGVILIFLGSIAPISLWGEFIKAPEPTHVERNFVPLELVKEINQDIDDRNFLAKPVALTVDDEGGLYVYDKRLIKIFKFDRNFKLVKTFAGQGRGPGELFGNSLPGQILEFWRGNLYVSDDGNRKIVVFSKKGERVREIPLPSTIVGSFPMVDARGNYYAVTRGKGALTMYNPKGKPLHEFMYKACYDRFVMYKPKEKYLPGIGNTWLLSNLSNTCYSLLAGNRLLVYLPYSSSLFIFKDNQMIRRFDLWPKHAMRLYKEEMERFARKIRKRGGDPGKWYSPMFGDFFVDRDDNRFFYLNGDGDGKAKQWLYKFNLEGELEAVLTSAKDIGFLAKRNNLFYGIYKGNIHILKEGKR